MKKLISMILFCLLPLTAFAAYNWPKHGYNVLKQTINTANKHIELTDPDGYLLTINYHHQDEEEQFPRIIELNKRFHSWQNIKIQTLNFNIQKNRISVVVVIDSFQQDGIDLKPVLPAGLLFTDSDRLQYNFRVVKNNILFRIKGDYKNETELTQKIQKALSGSLSEIDQSNPKSIYHLLAQKKAHIRQLDSEIQQATDANNQLQNKNQQLGNTIQQLEDKNQQALKAHQDLNNKVVSITHRALLEIFEDLKPVFELEDGIKKEIEKGLEIGTVQRMVKLVNDVPGITDVEIKNILAASGIKISLEVVSRTLVLTQ